MLMASPERYSRRKFLEAAELATATVVLTACLPRLQQRPKPAERPIPSPLTQPEIPSNTESLFSEKPFCVMFPGWTGGAAGLSAWRDAFHKYYGDDKAYVATSISRKEALQKGENQTRHYRNMAEHIASRMTSGKVRIFAHSAGVAEAPLLIEQLLNVWGDKAKEKEIELIYVCAPGFGKSGPDGLLNLSINFHNVIFDHSFKEQHTAFPLPEEVHNRLVGKTELPPYIRRLYTDTPEKRQIRRQTFSDEYIVRIIHDPVARQDILNKVAKIEEAMGQNIDNIAVLNRLLHERGVEIDQVVVRLFYGAQMDLETHTHFLTKYNETENDLGKEFVPYAIGYLGVGRLILSNILNGSEKGLSNLVQLTHSKGAGFNYYFAFSQLDPIMPFANLPLIAAALQKEDILENFAGSVYIDTTHHASFAHYPQALLPY